MALACALPVGLRISMASLRIPAVRRLPFTFGWMTKKPIDPDLFHGWLDAFSSDSGVRRDVRRMMRAVDRHQLIEAAARLRRSPGTALPVLAAEARGPPRDSAHRLTRALAPARTHPARTG